MATTAKKNAWSRARKVDAPYATFTSPDGWEWRVLKAYQTAAKEETNQYARWFCAVRSPFTYGGWEYGDTYCREVRANATACTIHVPREA